MRLTILLTAAVLAPAFAQTNAMKPGAPVAGVVVATEKSNVALPTIGALEKEMDKRLATTGTAPNDLCVVLGAGARGYYINGFGAVFTSEVELITTPAPGPFGGAPTPAQRTDFHKRKLVNVPKLEQTMRDMVMILSASPTLKLADNEQVVVAVRLTYRTWEDLADLPGQIVMRLDRRGGQVKMEIQ